MRQRNVKPASYKITTSVECVKPGKWFCAGDGRRFMKLQDILPSGIPQAYTRIDPISGLIYSRFLINSVDEDGITGSCPPGQEIFYVRSKNDLYPEGQTGPTAREVPNFDQVNGAVKGKS